MYNVPFFVPTANNPSAHTLDVGMYINAQIFLTPFINVI